MNISSKQPEGKKKKENKRKKVESIVSRDMSNLRYEKYVFFGL